MNDHIIQYGSGDFSGWVALLIATATLFWTVWCEFTGYRRRQADEYWYRTVFSPHCIEPLVQLLDAHLDSLSSLDVAHVSADELRVVSDGFAARKEAVLGRLWLSRMFSSDYYEAASAELDEIEDQLVACFSRWAFDASAREPSALNEVRNEAIERITKILIAASRVKLGNFRPRRSIVEPVRRLLLRSSRNARS